MKLLIINPGATSTKIAVFEDEEQLFKVTIDHSAEELDQFPRVIDQADYRKEARVAAIPRLTKKLSQVGQDALERLELPVNLAKGVARIELLGNREVYMDRHCGVLAYTTENIDVNGGTVVVRFYGRELRLLVMTGQELRITGVIERIELVE